jgi:hypothetical protein
MPFCCSFFGGKKRSLDKEATQFPFFGVFLFLFSLENMFVVFRG